MASPSEPRRKFPDVVPATKVLYDGARPRTIQVRTCRLVTGSGGARREYVFTQGTIRIGSAADNDLVLSDDTEIITRTVQTGFDRETGEVMYGEVPAGSVVVAGSMPSKGGINLYCAVIVKKVDAQTRSKTSINDLLRD